MFTATKSRGRIADCKTTFQDNCEKTELKLAPAIPIANLWPTVG